MTPRRAIDKQDFLYLWKFQCGIPTLVAVAKLLRTPYPTVRDWVYRNRIPGLAMAALEFYRQAITYRRRHQQALRLLQQPAFSPEQLAAILDGRVQFSDKEEPPC